MSALEACPCMGGNLNKLLRPAALSVLAGGPLHGYLIARRIEALRIARGCCPDTTGIYRVLHAMQKEGFVRARWDVSGAGPARRLYQLTLRGRKCLGRWADTLGEYDLALRQLLSLARKASRPAAAPRKRTRKAGTRRRTA